MELTGWLTALLVGVLVGVGGRLTVSGQRRIPLPAAVVIALAGAAVGTLVAWVFGVSNTPGIDWLQLSAQAGFALVGMAIGGYLMGPDGPP